MTLCEFFGKQLRPQFEKMLHKVMRVGALEVTFPDGSQTRFGESGIDALHVTITDWCSLERLTLNPELALGESYMDGKIVPTNGSVYDLVELLTRNLGNGTPPGLSRFARFAFQSLRALRGYNNPQLSKQNVAHHYDLDSQLYDLFLDQDRQYSCAYFDSPDGDLDTAQLAKKRHLAAKLALQPGHRVLDIGSGWGGLALYLAQMAGVSVKGITLSEEQIVYANNRAAGDDRVQFKLIDYRALTERFERIVSVGMFEHVGPKSYGEFFDTVNRLLTDDGVMVLHYIGRSATPSQTNPWVLKYIFPGGYMPSLSEVLPVIEKTGLIVSDIEVLRLHYARTLQLWRERFMAQRDKAVALYDERFARMWEFYLAASEVAFRNEDLVIHQIQLVKSKRSLPFTRDYIGKAEAELRGKDDTFVPARPKP